MGTLWADFMRAVGAGDRVFQLLDRQTAIPSYSGKRLPAVKGSVEFENVTFAYPTRPEVAVLSDIDLKVVPGEIVALVGPSGSGKSTLVGLIPRFYEPKSGTVLFDNNDIRSLDATWTREHIGMVAQEPVLLSTTIFSNIRYGKQNAMIYR